MEIDWYIFGMRWFKIGVIFAFLAFFTLCLQIILDIRDARAHKRVQKIPSLWKEVMKVENDGE